MAHQRALQAYYIPPSFNASPISILDLEPAKATVETSLNGIQEIPVSKIFYLEEPTTYALVTYETIKKNGFTLNKRIQTLDFSKIVLDEQDDSLLLAGYISAPPFEDQSNEWQHRVDSIQQRALDVHYGANVTLDYYFEMFNRNGVDGFGAQTLLNAVAPLMIDTKEHRHVEDGHNAFWTGININYGGELFGMMAYLDGIDRGSGEGDTGVIAGIDVLGHELTHGVVQYTAGLEYQGESGALNESMSDIFGTLVKVFSKDTSLDTDNWSWVMGEGFWPIRDMKNPEAYNHPATYHGKHWVNTEVDFDYGGVHINSGVGNHWFALAVDGTAQSEDPIETPESRLTNGNGFVADVRGLGLNKMQGVAYRALTNYLTSKSDYLDARKATIQSAQDLTRQSVADAYPGVPRLTKSDVEQIKAAWNAVGVGGGQRPSNLITTEADSDRQNFLGSSSNDHYIGSIANDIAKGMSGFDLLYGKAGDDKLNGGKNNDLLDGGEGNDRLIGGPGYDKFILSPGRDTIIDFTLGGDRVIWDSSNLVSIKRSELGYPILMHQHGQTHLPGVDYEEFLTKGILATSTQGPIGTIAMSEM